MKWWAGLLVALFSSALSAGASADPAQLPTPFVLPELSHPGADARLDWFLGRLAPHGRDRPGAIAAIAQLTAEGSVLVPRRLFVGLTYPFAAALPPDGGLAPGEPALPGGRRMLPGNAEAHVRAVFPLPMGLEIGFTLGVIAPTATFDRDYRPNRSAALAASSFDPANAAYFLPGRVALRPAGDLRIVRGPLVFQGRHGLDVLIDDSGIEQAKVAGRLLGHLGLLVQSHLELSIEGSQIYFFASDEKVSGTLTLEKAFAEKYRITDGHRTALTVGPGVRYVMRDFDLGASIVTNLTDPLSPASAGFVALRVSVIAHLGSSAR